ncbi:MAG: glutathione S-transferase N-terminal domain-containing protein [Burkholderiaceae bacterium]|jgi:glutathione S-transferase|nr:glutathione S-transferase N-terminal domain-containing protein [Burkholderiaceae bacterium]
MRLIGSLTSPFVRKVRIVLAEKKLDCPLIADDPWAEDASTPAANPLGKVPCLVLDDGAAVFDSRVIVEYLDTLSPIGSLIPPSGRARVEVKTWEALADGLLDAAILARNEMTWPGRAAAERSQAWMERQMGKVDRALAAMSRGLADKEWCLAGPQLTLADIAAGCALAWLAFRYPALDWRARHANLACLLDGRLMKRASFIDTAPPAA